MNLQLKRSFDGWKPHTKLRLTNSKIIQSVHRRIKLLPHDAIGNDFVAYSQLLALIVIMTFW